MRVLASVAIGLLLFSSQLWAQFGNGSRQYPRPQQPSVPATENLPAINPAKVPVVHALPNETALAEVAQKEAILQALREKKFDLQLVDTPLADFAKLLAAKLGVPVQMNVRALENIGLGPDMPITYAMTDLRAETHLRLILRELELTYLVTPYGVTITTPDEADNHEEARFYPLGDLVYLAEATPAFQPDFDSIINVIDTSIRPESWQEGGSLISPINDGVSIAQTHGIHEEIAGLLKAIRQAKAYPGDAYPTEALSIYPHAEETTELRRQLATRQVSARFNDTPLKEVIAHVAKAGDIRIIIDHRSLSFEGLAEDIPITLTVDEIPLKQVLDMLAEQYELSWYTFDNVVVITTPDEAENELETRIYPVRDLLWCGLDASQPEVRQLLESIHLSGFGGYFWGNSRDVGTIHAPPMNDVDTLIEAITTTVSCDSWENLGGPGSITPLDECLIISQTEHVHEKVAALLADVRRHPRKFDPQAIAQQVQTANAEAEVVMYQSPVDKTGAPMLTQEDLQAIAARVKTLVATETWDGDQHFLDPVHSGLIVRNRKDVQRKVAAYLKQINLQPPPPPEIFLGNGQGGGGFGGGGFGNTPTTQTPTQPPNATPTNQSGGFF
ncbi:DUF4974 domain-containing protein [Blastopirellula marina]|uniref:NolW-like domain-containing protein n=1 Tax=Blastopirellula marina TaxID=124 RepID=A0A2S8FCR9_9BACT|nr:DUF4974 domain-containing protein [Blastopirellula marina]PQO29971.1 hypothetical protein C5Y98_22175 [Blastopirellula marina]PTL42439.1 hypothetical protein C5Y97_22185 [Blastopirellula marina]